MTLREQIKMEMQAQGLTQVVMAERMGITQPELSTMLSENRELGMTEVNAIKAAKALGKVWVLADLPKRIRSKS